MYAYGENNVINGSDLSGYKWNWGKILTGAVIAITTVAIITVAVASVTVGVPHQAASTIVGAAAGAGAQMMANVFNDEPLLNSVAGAALGGAVMGLTGNPLQASLMNSTVNQLENVSNNGEYNLTQFMVETASYTLLNMVPGTRMVKNGIPLSGSNLLNSGLRAFLIDSEGFVLSEKIIDLIPQVIISTSNNSIKITVNGSTVSSYQFD